MGVGELADEELYPADAAWAGVCDRMAHPPEEAMVRRVGMVKSRKRKAESGCVSVWENRNTD
ncbi:MAG TPA: hypothetical protein DCS43_01100 [Verrucomicrobia bacterium]|nr:hypothetical protein [Verrucomicrobiota bacterium]